MRIELPYDEILSDAEAAGDYHEFTPDRLREMLERFDQIIPRAYYNEGNPNNGERAYKLAIGREGSMVVYLNLQSLWSSENGYEAIQAVSENSDELERIARQIGKADEFDITHRKDAAGYYDEVEIRIWWD